MKYLFLILTSLVIFSCSKKNSETETEISTLDERAPYDTIATDSFANGATANNVILKRDSLPSAPKDSLKSIKKEESLKEKEAAAEKAKKEKDAAKKKEAANKPITELETQTQ